MPIQVGGNVQPTGQVDQLRTFALAFTGGAGSSGVFASMANPEGQTFIITHATLRITTQSTGASTLDIGIAADATTSNDGIIDGLSGASAGIFSNIVAATAGTNGRPAIVWGASQYLNIAEASGDVAALVGTLYVSGFFV